MIILAIQKQGSFNNLLVSSSGYGETLLAITHTINTNELVESNEITKIPEHIDFNNMVKYINEVSSLMKDDNSTRFNSLCSGDWQHVYSELMGIYIKHGYDLTILTQEEKHKALNQWCRALAESLKEAGFKHYDTSYSEWSYRKKSVKVHIPYTLRNFDNCEFVARVTDYSYDKDYGCINNIKDLEKILSSEI
tara:strand:+ start:992 stop:1570 length:579 start_codon:yes stop_codon:yes gene_type:complete